MDGIALHVTKEEESEQCSVSRKSGHRSFEKDVILIHVLLKVTSTCLDIVGTVYHLVIYICSPTRYTMWS